MFTGDRFGADLDGTVVTVVDFDTSLIATAAPHTADNSALWLAARTDVIPPRGTRCVLMIDSAVMYHEVKILPDGSLVDNTGPTSPAKIADRLAAHKDPAMDLHVRFELSAVGGCGETLKELVHAQKTVEAALIKAGVAPARIEVLDRPLPEQKKPAPRDGGELSKTRKPG